MSDNIFSKFTNLYSLSKTLRFELKPVGKTLENMKKQLEYDEELQTFLYDQEIENAYQTLKPVLDQIHEEFITRSLESKEAREIDFSEFFEKYKTQEDDKGEKTLRKAIGETYERGELFFKNEYSSLKWQKGSKEAKGAVILECQDVLEILRQDYTRDKKIQEALDVFKGFFTYFGGFNQNRANYYETEKEKVTAIATRIVHENLPKFCDNVLLFEDRSSEYLSAYKVLQEMGKSLVNKEQEKLVPVDKNWFDIRFFNACLSQKGVEIYNDLIGNANFLINLYNQSHNKTENFRKLLPFKTLYKQIGCGKKEALFFELTHNTRLEAEEARKEGKNAFSVEEVLNLAEKSGEKYFQSENNDSIINTVTEFLKYISEKKDYDGVYWSKAAMNTISNKYFANYHTLKDRLKEAKIFQKPSKGSEEDTKIPEAIELSGLFAVLDATEDWRTTFFKESLVKELATTEGNKEENEKRSKRRNIIDHAKTPSKALLEMVFDDIRGNAQKFLDLTDSISKLKDYKSKEGKETIKQWMDYALAVNQMLKYFFVRENKIKGTPLDTEISEGLKNIVFEAKLENDTEVNWFKWYDALRNYLTKKSKDDAKKNKLKLNFENSTLAGGWDVNKETANGCVLLRSTEGKIFLSVMHKKHNILFQKEWIEGRGKNKDVRKNPLYDISDGCEIFEKMEYKQIATPTGVGGFVRKCFGTAQQLGWECYEDCLNSDGKIITKNDEVKNLESLINCYKNFFEKYEKDGFKYKDFNFVFRDSKKYEKLTDFFSEVEIQGYKLSFSKINKDVLNSLVEEGKIYLFEIKNQDSNSGKKDGHKNNLHTIYWHALFQEIKNRPKLNGEAEIFYRKAISEKDIRKKIHKGKEIIENYRFSKEKFVFHVPITLNFCLDNKKTNDLVNSLLPSLSHIHFFGIDRGEKHLAYYSLVNQKGEIVDQGTLNMPFLGSIKKEKYFYDKKEDKWKSKEVKCCNYNDLLDAMSSNRDMARKNWQTIGTIKELKEGYISQVVKKISDIATNEDHPAFIVLEDLNTGFKRGRQKIEKSVYQKFELALAKKLNFLVNKTAQNGAIGSVTKAIQLTPPVQNYQDIENRKQVGVMLYTRANYTSQTDPVTGWRKTIYLQSGPEETTYTKDGKVKNKSIRDQILEKFTDIRFDGKDYVFEYKTYIADKNTGEVFVEKQWKMYSGINGKSLDRFRGKRGEDKYEWKNEPQNIVYILEKVLAKFNKNKSLLTQIKEGVELTKYDEYTAWESLRFAIELIQQIRNTGNEGDERNNDFILSPVRDEQTGKHFDSREYWDREQKGEKVNLPTSGDANGAYNIARKGLLMNEHIRSWIEAERPKYDKSTNDLNLFISESEWDLSLVDKKAWKQQLQKFSSRKALEGVKEKRKK
ncbi:type V CRISPR-associated protein Cas12a/Cpf1 [Candidatus Gracilibacteria bacterium]|nr:type V CRISPR-associated protein Cas12a/Cpf1 [Candidatus Gracilibacteria bacterium]